MGINYDIPFVPTEFNGHESRRRDRSLFASYSVKADNLSDIDGVTKMHLSDNSPLFQKLLDSGIGLGDINSLLLISRPEIRNIYPDYLSYFLSFQVYLGG